MRALITGHRGFVGRHLSRALSARGYLIVGVDIDGPNGTDAREFFRHDTGRYDLVVHLAAVVGGRRLIDGNPLALAVDLSLDAELFGWALRTRPGRIVYFSSSAAYPTHLQASEHRLREDEIDLTDPRIPDQVYGWAKLTGEILASKAREQDLAVTVLRPFSGYGTDQASDYPFRAFIDRAQCHADPFDVWGDGEQVRDFIHIDDICEATCLAVEQQIDGPINLGTGRATSFNELAQIITQAAGYTPTIRHRTNEPIGVSYRVADPNLLHTFYTPQISLEEGVGRALFAMAAA